ncbi:MAG: TRAP transporter substrate-binding protein DctP [Paracoccaceae bacterium]
MTSTTRLTAALSALLIATPAAADTLRVADSFPVGHYIAENLLRPFMTEVTEATGTDFEYFPAQQLGKAKDMLNLTLTGVADIGYVVPSYVSDKLPLSSVGELPEAFSTSCEGSLAFYEIGRPGGPLDKAELAPNGVRLLSVLIPAPYQLFSAQEITGLESIEGMKIRSTGGAKEIAINKLGGVPVQMAAPEAREALSRGTVDAIVFPNPSILPYDLTPHLKSATEGANFGSAVLTYMISEKKWNELPADVQAAMDEASMIATRTGCEAADRLSAEDAKTIAGEGVDYVTLPEADGKKLESLMSEVSAEWAAEQDGYGRSGTGTLNAFREALAKQ